MKVLSKILPSKLTGHSKKLLLVSAMIFPISAAVFAAQDSPVVIKGVVATSSDKQQLLEKLKAQYPNKTVRDEIEVRSSI